MRPLKNQLADLWAAVTLFLIGAAGTLAAVFLWLIPKRDREQREAADKRAEALRVKLAAAKAERDKVAADSIATIDSKAADSRAADSVDVANQFILGETKK